MLQTFLATMAVMTLSMAALVWVRDRESALLQTIIDRIPVMISVYEPNTKVVRLNRAFEELTGWATAEARGTDLMAQCYPDPAYRARVRGDMDTCPPGWQDVDMTMTTKDGRVIATSWTNVRLADDMRVGIGLDVRERKRVEGERERAQAEAEAASRTKDEFFAMLGHELRNPLGVITTALHIVEVTDPLDERNAKARQIIARQVVILVRLVDDLLDVTRLATGKIVLSSSPVNLSAAAQRAVTAVSAGAPGRHITCHALDDLWIQADETRLEQILLNLLHNAVKFTPADGRVIVAVMGEGTDAILRVEDTGAGIPADLLPRIFELFARGGPACTGPEPVWASGSRSSSALSISTRGKSTSQAQGRDVEAPSRSASLGSNRPPAPAPPRRPRCQAPPSGASSSLKTTTMPGRCYATSSNCRATRCTRRTTASGASSRRWCCTPTPSSSISVFPVSMAIRSPSASGPRAAETWSSSL